MYAYPMPVYRQWLTQAVHCGDHQPIARLAPHRGAWELPVGGNDRAGKPIGGEGLPRKLQRVVESAAAAGIIGVIVAGAADNLRFSEE